MVNLGTLERVNIRDVWEHEASDFTPWLAKNLSLLGEALGMDLELQDLEAPVGGFSLDILAQEVATNRLVIIENQLEATDHSHLGQLLTYATGYDAKVVVWIARDFRDEHRAALDWLNERTDDDTEFFGVVVELLKIDNSRPAVNIKLVSTPNKWRREGSGNGSNPPGGTSERQERYRDFWQTLTDSLRDEHNFTQARRSQHRSWFLFSAGFWREG